MNTDFSRFRHELLYAMVQAGDETSVRSAATSWADVGARLHEQTGNLEAKLAEFRKHWQGGAAEQYQTMVVELAGGLRRIADAALTMRDLTHDAADALVKAQRDMPVPVAVPDIPAELLRLATVPLEVDPLAPPEHVAWLRQRQLEAIAAMREQWQAAQQSGVAHAKAVAVMTELAREYRRADAAIPGTPGAPRRPCLTVADGEKSLSWLGFGGLPGDPDRRGGTPAFGTMFTAGLAAASAASAGRLGTPILPAVPPWAQKEKPEAEEAPPAEVPDSFSDKGFGGGGGVVGAGGVIGAGTAAPAPAAFPGMASAPAAVPGAFRAAAAGAGGADAGLGAGMMPFFPFMPMTPMDGMAGGRRVPQWLTETEDVWGQASVFTPPVVGED